jgi:hypothetical protein
MSVHDEVEEHIHHAAEPFDKRVAGSMAIVAALLAVVSVWGQHLTTEEVLLQQRSSDQWAYYQAKSIRRYMSETTRDTVNQVKGDPAVVKHYDQESARYKKEGDDIQKEAQGLQDDSKETGRKAVRVHGGEVFLEVAIVFSSLAILTKRNILFVAGLTAALVGIGISLSALLLT